LGKAPGICIALILTLGGSVVENRRFHSLRICPSGIMSENGDLFTNHWPAVSRVVPFITDILANEHNNRDGRRWINVLPSMS
jgi:hypothetical protein